MLAIGAAELAVMLMASLLSVALSRHNSALLTVLVLPLMMAGGLVTYSLWMSSETTFDGVVEVSAESATAEAQPAFEPGR